MDFTDRFGRNPDFVHRKVGEEEILVPVRRSGSDLSSIFLLNAVGAAVWDYLAQPRTGNQLVSALVEEFDVDRQSAAADLAVFLDDLVKVDAIWVEARL